MKMLCQHNIQYQMMSKDSLDSKWFRKTINRLLEKDVNEKVQPYRMKKVYDEKDVSKWVNYGLRKGYIDNDDEDIIKWISLLKSRNIDL